MGCGGIQDIIWLVFRENLLRWGAFHCPAEIQTNVCVRWMITSELCSLGPHLIFFFLTCSFVSVLSSLQLMSYWQLYSSLLPPFSHAGSFPLLGKVLLRLARHDTHLLGGGRCSARMKTKWFCPSLLSSSERSASPSCFSSCRGRPRHVAIARLNHIHCSTALQVCLQCTLRETGHKTAMKTSQHSATRETVHLW